MAALRCCSVLLLTLAPAGCGDRTPPALWPEPPPPTLARPIGGPAGGHGPAAAPIAGSAALGPPASAAEGEVGAEEPAGVEGGRVPPAPVAVPERRPSGAFTSPD